MSKVAACSGGAGDLVYAIPVMRELGVETVYVKENFYGPGEGSLYSNIKPLLEYNGFKVLPTSGGYPVGHFEPGLEYDYNLDLFREMPNRGRVHIMINMRIRFGLPIPDDWTKPWLKPLPDWPQAKAYEYISVAVTKRWREGSKVNWNKVLTGLPFEYAFVLGLKEDVQSLHEEVFFNVNELWYETKDFWEMAHVINASTTLFCNQGVALTIAQGLGKPYWCEFKPGKSNTMLRTKNEHILK